VTLTDCDEPANAGAELLLLENQVEKGVVKIPSP
jgi:hypothetical protein